MTMPLRLCLVVYWLGLAAWLSGLVTAGISATMVFGQLPDMSLSLQRFEAYPVDEHGTIAAGLVMADVFFAVDVVQFIAIPLVVITLALQLAVFGVPARRPANVVRTACLLVAAALFAWYALLLAPSLNSELRLFWQAAEAADLDAAQRHRELFGADHTTARHILEVNLLLVLVSLAASAMALGPAPGPRRKLDPPLLAANP